MVTALLEGTLREDVTWRPVVTIVTVGLAPVLLWRRTRPLACVMVGFGTGMVLGLASQLAGIPGVGLNTMIYILVLVYALVRWGSGRQIVIGLVVVLVAAVFSIATDYTGPAELFGGLGILAAAAAGGAAFRYRAESRRRAFDQIRSQERVGLARELHDSVAHHVSAITLQAQAGRTMAGKRPEAALEALSVIEGEASRTLAEMRAMVRVLRNEAPADYAPQPGVAELERLSGASPTGPRVEVTVSGDLAALPRVIDAAVFRIAQEAVTNALRHARNATLVDVRVAGDQATVSLAVRDDGDTGPGDPDPEAGFGLAGMVERALLLGGTCRAGLCPGGGWAVVATLPR